MIDPVTEMNAFAAVRSGRDLADCALLRTQQPCSMCAAAAAFLEVVTVRHLAPDPWALASGQPDNAVSVGPGADLWVVTANLLFVLSIVSRAGVDHPTVVGNRKLEPETTGLVLDMAAEGLVAPAWTNGRSLVEVLPARWDRIVAAATARAERMGGNGEPDPALGQQRRQPMATESSDLPKLAAPARRALLAAGYTRLEDLTRVTESEVMALHGMGPNAMETLRRALEERGLSFGA